MDIMALLRAVRKNWWIVLLAVGLAAGAAAFVTFQTAPKYASTVTFFVNTPAENIAGAAAGDSFGQKRVNTYAQLIRTDQLAKRVVEDLGNGITPQYVAESISAQGDSNTVLLTAEIIDTSAQMSLRIANSVATQFVELVAELETTEAGKPPAVRLDIVNGPTLNPTPVDPNPALNIGLGLLVGILIGVAAAILRDVLDKSVRSVEHLQELSGAPVIGHIAFDTDAKKSPLILDSHAKSIRAEAFRHLRTNLQFVDAASPVKMIVVTSSIMDEGKSSTACNLAVSFAEAGKKVLLIEADLRRPRVADYLGIEGSVGLTNVLAGQVQLIDVLQAWGRGGLTVLASGSIPPNPSELLGSQNMAELLQAVRESFEIVIIDTPPLLPVTDAAVVAAAADGALMVVRHGTTTQHQVQTAIHALEAVDARVLGCVLNMVPVKGANAYDYRYGRTYYETDAASTRPKLDISDKSAPSLGVQQPALQDKEAS